MSDGLLEYTFCSKAGAVEPDTAKMVVIDRARRLVHFQNCHLRGRIFSLRAQPLETFAFDEILAVYERGRRGDKDPRSVYVITPTGKALVIGQDDSGITFDEFYQQMHAMAPDDLRAPAEEHPLMPLLYVVGGLLGMTLFLSQMPRDSEKAWMVLGGGLGIVLGIGGVFWTVRLAHQWLGIKLPLPIGLGLVGALAGLVLFFSPILTLVGFLVGLSTGVVLERRKSRGREARGEA
jgi:hypothetical protein